MNKIVFYRDKCIGCGICYEQQPALWRMSRKDGKAVLLNSTNKKNVFVLPISMAILHQTKKLALLCPLKIIKVL